MKIKAYSWILAGAYLIWGIALFIVVPKCTEIFSGFARLPFLTQSVLALGSFGWLGIALAAGALVVLKDLRFRSRLLSILLTAVLLVWMCCMAIALFLPFTLLISPRQARVESPNKSLQPTPGGAGISAFAGHVTGPAWLSLGRSATSHDS
jgi:hypothetical protein